MAASSIGFFFFFSCSFKTDHELKSNDGQLSSQDVKT